MKNQIPNDKQRKPVFSYLAFALPILTLILYYSMFSHLLSGSIKVTESILPVSSPVKNLSWLTLLSGVVFSLMSYSRGEKSRLFKTGGMILNLILSLFVIGAIIYATILDVLR